MKSAGCTGEIVGPVYMTNGSSMLGIRSHVSRLSRFEQSRDAYFVDQGKGSSGVILVARSVRLMKLVRLSKLSGLSNEEARITETRGDESAETRMIAESGRIDK
ncbi:hypothetical protein Sjap_003059 [Stephania japonica]|uniref:Uncharacterized protein n=1 Tax=Stephania japonica TaxID=461633 RepID=A0AAP0KQE9_9MAGN